MIMQGRAPLRLSLVGLFSLALIGAATLPAWATGQLPPPPPPPPPTPVVSQVAPTPPAPPARATTPTRERTAVRQTLPPPPPPPPPPTRERRIPPPPPPPPAKAAMVQGRMLYALGRPQLPAEGTKLLQDFDADREAIQKEAEQKVVARREALKKALENLQEQYTKAGKLDEAIAIRDYLRAGLPGAEDQLFSFFLRNKIVK